MAVNIKDIAKELDISAMTVSRALNNKGRINKETRSKIIKKATKMGYVPNALARGLVLNRTFTIGLVISNIANPFYAKITRIIQKEASINGFRLILFNTDESINMEKEALYSLREQRCDGVILTATEKDYTHIADSIQNGLPIVLINRRPEKIKIDFVVCDNKKGAYLATSYLLGLGHKRIAHITGPSYVTSVREKINGYKKAFENNGLQIDPKLVYRNELTLESAYKATIELLENCSDVTAIFAFSDWMAIGVIKALMENHVKIPEEISIVGYDNIDVSPYLKVPLTTVDLPIELMGKRSIEVLLDYINNAGKNRTIVNDVFQPKFIERESCKKIN